MIAATRSILLGAAVLVAAAGCATGGAPASPAAGPGPAGAARPADAAVPADSARAAETADAAESPPTLRDLAARARARVARPPGRPILPFGVAWSPEPREGAAFAVRILQRPSGREPASVEGEFAGLPVRFAPWDGQWLGLAAAPIGRAGEEDLVLRFAFADGSEREQRVPVRVADRTFASTRLRVAPKYASPPAAELERIAAERELVRAVLDTAGPDWLFDEPFRAPRPLDVTSPFGVERLFNGELQSRHTGLDLRGATGTPVRAAARGRVVIARDLYFSGNGVYVDHGRGVYTGYFHLSRILVKEGDIVVPGQVVGEVGATGRVTGPHLHWSLWVSGQALDPSSLLQLELPGDGTG
ncbi:MAG: M23 family metallopeptidase [Gemmatimonadota bacterium]|nr:M23 family metallopeptidase [Gemmatimonadota bacterium]